MSLFLDQWRQRSPHYCETHHQWAASVRRFVEREAMPHIDAWEAAGELPRSLHKAAAQAGLIGLGYPEAYGGTSEGVDLFHGMVTTAELARTGAGGLGASLMTHGIGLPPILAVGSDALKQRIAPPVLAGEKIICLAITEPGGGSDVASLQTRAEKRGDRYIVTGSKMYITSGIRADWYTVAVRTGGEGAGGVSLLLLEKGMPGFTQTRLDKMGWHCSDTAALYFDGVEVPAENLIGSEGAGFPAIMLNFNKERLGMAAGCAAFAWVCIEEALEYARERRTFGKRLVQHQVIRHKLAEMVRQTSATQAWVDQCAWAEMNHKAWPADLALLKVQATRTLEFVAREAAQILGGASYVKGSKTERIYREVRVNAIGGGSEEIMLDLAARQMGF
jgi:acyl-CoA dehydrogenase